VLGTPPALILSQDQTLRFFFLNSNILTGCFCLVVKEHGFSADLQPPPRGIIA
jgi:hypothetical protein